LLLLLGLSFLGLLKLSKPDSSGNTFCHSERLAVVDGIEGQKDWSEWRDCCNRRITASAFQIMK